MNPGMDAAGERRLWTRAWGAFVDANPVLAKELLVTVRAPAFRVSMIGVPLVLGAVVLLVRAVMGRFDPNAGHELFPFYFTGLSMALGTVGAALGSTVLVQEREAGALEALKFSALSPARLVLGKVAAVVLAEVAVVVGTTPLLAFILSLRGVSLEEIWVAMSIALACGIMTASLGVAVSAHATNTRRSLSVSLLGAAVVGIGVMSWLAVGSELGPWYGPFGVVQGYRAAPWSDRYVAVLFVIPAYALATLLWFAYAVATAGLMDASDDRNLPIKRWAVGAYALGMAALVAVSGSAPQHDRAAIAGGSMFASGILAAVLLFVFAGEPLRPTRRMQAHPRSLWVRVLYPWCLAPSILFALAAGGGVLLAIPALSGAPAGLELYALWAVACLSVLGGLLGAIAARRGAMRARRIGAGVVTGFIFLYVLLRAGSPGSTWADGICPLGLDMDAEIRAQSVLTCSLATWGAAGLLSLAIMLRAVRSRAA